MRQATNYPLLYLLWRNNTIGGWWVCALARRALWVIGVCYRTYRSTYAPSHVPATRRARSAARTLAWLWLLVLHAGERGFGLNVRRQNSTSRDFPDQAAFNSE